jgi:hypothetical protein
MRLNCVILVSYDFSYTYVGEWDEKHNQKFVPMHNLDVALEEEIVREFKYGNLVIWVR